MLLVLCILCFSFVLFLISEHCVCEIIVSKCLGVSIYCGANFDSIHNLLSYRDENIMAIKQDKELG